MNIGRDQLGRQVHEHEDVTLTGDNDGSTPRRYTDAETELKHLRTQLAVAQARLLDRRRTRLGIALRILRAAFRDRRRRHSLLRDLARAIGDRSVSSHYYKPNFSSTEYPLPKFTLPTGPITRPNMTAAVILDSFSSIALHYEWNQVSIHPSSWHNELSATKPDLLFVESAWHGNGGSWRLHMTESHGPSVALRQLVVYCRANAIPTVFWNKEDPPNYDKFIETARLFEYVFTVDEDCIPRYIEDLGHRNVYLLPFAAQPRVHSPIRRGAGRVYDVAFAGSYFADKHAARRAQMDYVLEPAIDFGLHIYSRLQNEASRYRFPATYSSNIVGSLPYEEMLSAYTSYKVFVNVNSVTTSRSMCARRLFELSASQTPVVSGPSAAIKRYFGDAIRIVESANDTRQALSSILRHNEYRDRLGLEAHRRVFEGNLYTHRVDSVLRTIGLPVDKRNNLVSVVVPTNRPYLLDNVFSSVGTQTHPEVQLVLVLHGFTVPEPDLISRARDAGIVDLVPLRAASSTSLGECMNLGVEAADGYYIAKMDDDNFYGRRYLSDQLNVFDFTDAQVVGKWAHFVYLESTGATLLRFPRDEHRYVRQVQGGTLVMRRELAKHIRFDDLPARVDSTFLDHVRAQGGTIYSSDRFNFVSVRRKDVDSHTWKILETELLAGESKLLFYGEPFVHAEA